MTTTTITATITELDNGTTGRLINAPGHPTYLTAEFDGDLAVLIYLERFGCWSLCTSAQQFCHDGEDLVDADGCAAMILDGYDQAELIRQGLIVAADANH